jgi:UDP-N-acetylglucosamine 1-carboxyvinyltransferase
MSEFHINGGKRLYGEISVSGAKNSVLPLIAATLLCKGESVLHNCPLLSDVKISIKILEFLGCKCKLEGHTLTVNSENAFGTDIPESLMREMRSSIVFMGAVVAKNGSVCMSLPGGCELGPRPIDLHIDVLERLGADVSFDGGKIFCEAENGIKSNDIHLRFPSVGATENAVLASVLCSGETVIRNVAREPEIVDLCMFLKQCGAKIFGEGTDTITVVGVKELNGTEYTVMPDRIVAATYLFGTAICSGKIKLNNVKCEHIMTVLSLLKDSGCDVIADNNGVILASNGRLKSFDTVSTQPYPGFPTDAGPLLVAFATTLKGTSVFIENIFDNRFRYIGELIRLGAKIKTVGRIAVISGVKNLSGAAVSACDLRGGAALTIAGMGADGVTKVDKVCYIDRGYENLEDSFNLLGADIKRC